WDHRDQDVIYLDYQVNFGPRQYATLDTLVVQSRNVIMETFTPTYNK
ncbi:DUF5627 domain-containing protein, partial [uncultured Muribaculum sp.]